MSELPGRGTSNWTIYFRDSVILTVILSSQSVIQTRVVLSPVQEEKSGRLRSQPLATKERTPQEKKKQREKGYGFKYLGFDKLAAAVHQLPNRLMN